MKTIKELINQQGILSDIVRDEVIENIIMMNDDPEVVFNSPSPNIHSALFVAFSWADSAQGYSYWDNVATKAKIKEFTQEPQKAN